MIFCFSPGNSYIISLEKGEARRVFQNIQIYLSGLSERWSAFRGTHAHARRFLSGDFRVSSHPPAAQAVLLLKSCGKEMNHPSIHTGFYKYVIQKSAFARDFIY